MNTFGARLVTFEIALLSLSLLGVAIWLLIAPELLTGPPGPPAVAGRIVSLAREAPTSTRTSARNRVRVAIEVPLEQLSPYWFGGRELAPDVMMPVLGDLVLPSVADGWGPGTRGAARRGWQATCRGARR